MEHKDEIKERTLEDICTGMCIPAFSSTLINTEYCMLRPVSPDVRCRYRSKSMDKNGLYQCNFYLIGCNENNISIN